MDELALKSLIQTLEASRDFWSIWLNVFSGMVAVGVVAEIAFIIREYVENLHGWKRGIIQPPDRPSRAWLIMELAGVALVVVGVAGEFYVDLKAGDLETRIRKANAQLILSLEQRVGDAAVSAKVASDAAGLAQKRVTAVNTEANALSAILKKETAVTTSLGPRSLVLNSAAVSMTQKLLPFAGQKVVVERCGSPLPTPDGEPLHIAWDFSEKEDAWGSLFEILVQDAKWGSLEKSLRIWNKCFLRRGVTVFFNAAAPLKTQKAAAVLGDELKRVLPPQDPPYLATNLSDIAIPPFDEDDPLVMVTRDPKLIVVTVGDQPAPHPQRQ